MAKQGKINLSNKNVAIFTRVCADILNEPAVCFFGIGHLSAERLEKLMNAARQEGRDEARSAFFPSKAANEKTPHPGFLVWNPRSGPPRYTHETIDSAQTEAKRLAVQVHSTPFYVLAPVGAAFADVTVLPVMFNAVPHVDRPAFDLDSEIPF